MPKDGWQEVYHIAGRTDIDVLRTQATQILNHPRFPVQTLLHRHEKGLPCDIYQHELFEFPKEEDAARTDGEA